MQHDLPIDPQPAKPESSTMSNQALLVVDVQNNMVTGPYSVPDAQSFLERFALRIEEARAAGWPVVWVQNDGPEGDVDEPGSEGWQLYFEPLPGDRVVRKTTQDVFESNPDLAAELKSAGVSAVELIGMQSEFCVQSSARGAKAAGFKVALQPNLHATFHDGTPMTNLTKIWQVSATALSDAVHQSLIEDGTLDA
jgi:nicotinamidase-related amidase